MEPGVLLFNACPNDDGKEEKKDNKQKKINHLLGPFLVHPVQYRAIRLVLSLERPIQNLNRRRAKAGGPHNCKLPLSL